jgi:hypothetical protein
MAMGQVATQGSWTTLPFLMPINPIHMALMHNGRLLIVSGSGNVPSNNRLQMPAECEQAAVTVLHHKLTRAPWHIGKTAHEFHALSCVLGVKRVRIFDEHIRVKQFV